MTTGLPLPLVGPDRALLPPADTGGRPEKHPRRSVVDAILYVVRTGCSWQHLPVDFPPWQRRVLVLLPLRTPRSSSRSCPLCAADCAPRTDVGASSRRDHRLPEHEGRQHHRPGAPELCRVQEGQRPQEIHRRRRPGVVAVGVRDGRVCPRPGQGQDYPPPPHPARHRVWTTCWTGRAFLY